MPYSLDLIRRKRHHDRRPRGRETDAMLSIPASTPGPDRVAYSIQVQESISSAMAELTEQERTAFVLALRRASPSRKRGDVGLASAAKTAYSAPYRSCGRRSSRL